MLPLKLIIEGMFSYRNRVEIDFQDLTAAGLFGIFGATGSGKSTILEAISFVLYGNLDRLNKKDGISYNLMNLRSDEMHLVFEFLNFENKHFRAEYHAKRSKKNYENISQSTRSMYALEDENWVSTEENAEKILGISYENFKRTIIIPQGQFQEFLELGATARTEMMQELFHLDEFDLSYKVQRFSAEVNGHLSELKGELSMYDENVSKEGLNQLEENFRNITQQVVDKEKIFIVATDKLNLLKNNKENFEKLQTLQNEFNTLEIQQKEFSLREQNLKEYEVISQAFSLLVEQKKQASIRLSEQQQKLNLEKEDAAKNLKEKEAVESEWTTIKQAYEALPNERKKEEETQKIGDLLTLKNEINQLQSQKALAEKLVVNSKNEKKEKEAFLQDFSTQKKALQQKIIAPNLLLDLSNWFSRKKELLTQQKECNSKIESCETELKSLLNDLKIKQIDKPNYLEFYERQKSEIEDKRMKLEEQLIRFSTQQELAKFSKNLHDGDACPVCGSTSHPNILRANHVTDEIEHLKENRKLLDSKRKKLEENFSAYKEIAIKQRECEKVLNGERKKSLQLTEDLKKHELQFIWSEIIENNAEKFEEASKISNEASKEMKALENEIERLQKEMDHSSKQTEQQEENLKQFELNIHAKNSIFISTNQNLKLLKFEDFENKSIIEIHENLQTLIERNNQTEKKYQFLDQRLKEIENRIIVNNTSIKSISEQIKEIDNEINILQSEIHNSLTIHQTTIEKVSEILNRKLNIFEERNEIEAFNKKYIEINSNLNSLREATKGIHFKKEDFEEAQTNFNQINIEFDELKRQKTILEENVKNVRQKLKEKIEKLNKFAQLEKRSENLQLLWNLFKGKAFVNYISSVYLQNLCEVANKRFMQLTRNQLRLQLNEKNEFEIIDFLNEGHVRNIKTLSGGQSFQVSLCLALALAESVQTRSETERNFFFIDEGFGTLDKDSIPLVFETLMHLNRENKVVGIISHVDELKEQISVSLHVIKDEQEGSRIVME